MKVIALVAEKGGSGKSTIAVHLAVCAARQGKTVAVVDLDPQGSARHWSERRGEAALNVPVVVATAQELPGLLQSAREQEADLVILDTAGRSDIVTAHVVAAADVIAVPCRPSIYDLESSRRTVEVIRSSGDKKAAVILNSCPSRGSRSAEAREALEELIQVAPVELHQLVAYSDALNDGRSVEELEPKGAAATEIRALYDWLASL